MQTTIAQYFNEYIKPLSDELDDLLNNATIDKYPIIYEQLPEAYETCEYDGAVLQLLDVYAEDNDPYVFCNKTCRRNFMTELETFK
jgi:hypothetical protein